MNADPELRAQIATIQTSLVHLEKQMEDMRTDHKEHRLQTTTLLERTIKIEESESRLLGLPSRVSTNEKVSAIQDAIRDTRQDAFEDMRKVVFGGIAVAGTLASILTIIIDRMWT